MKIAIAGTVFKFNLISVILFFTLFTLLILLGFWQLGRADEKRAFLTQQQESIGKKNIDLLSLVGSEPASLRYRQTEIKGHYDQDHQFLIDNQIVNGKVGYFVTTPFVLEGISKAVLVNRGWIPLNKDRNVLPDIKVNTSKKSLLGRINNFPSVGIKLAGAEIPTKGWPSVVQVIDSHVLSTKLGYPLFPFQVELAPTMNDGYIRDWKKNTLMPPEKHIAYAVQWFGLAITLTILFIGFSRKK